MKVLRAEGFELTSAGSGGRWRKASGAVEMRITNSRGGQPTRLRAPVEIRLYGSRRSEPLLVIRLSSITALLKAWRDVEVWAGSGGVRAVAEELADDRSHGNEYVGSAAVDVARALRSEIRSLHGEAGVDIYVRAVLAKAAADHEAE